VGGLRQLAANGFYVASTPSSSFVYLLTGTHAIHLMGGVLALVHRRRRFAFAPLRGNAEHCGGCDRVVLAFPGRAVVLHFVFAGVCQLTVRF